MGVVNLSKIYKPLVLGGSVLGGLFFDLRLTSDDLINLTQKPKACKVKTEG